MRTLSLSFAGLATLAIAGIVSLAAFSLPPRPPVRSCGRDVGPDFPCFRTKAGKDAALAAAALVVAQIAASQEVRCHGPGATVERCQAASNEYTAWINYKSRISNVVVNIECSYN